MFRNYLLIAWRNLKKNRVFSFVNITGLAMGLAALCCISLYILHESNYDRFHPHADRLYRLISTDSTWGNMPTVNLFSPLAPPLREKVPGVEKLARIEVAQGAVFRHGNTYFTEEDFQWADPEVFDLFRLPLRYGSPRTALREPNSLVLTAEAARKYFGGENPLGKVLHLDTIPLTVTGVLEPLPTYTHLRFTMLGSYSTHKNPGDPWMHQGSIYVRLHPGTAAGATEARITKAARQATWWFRSQGTKYRLQPVGDINLHSAGFTGSKGGNDVKYLYIFGVVALVIALSTAFNYINLATARYTHRAKEVGIRKAIGATRGHLVGQFLGESVLFALAGLLGAVTLLQVSFPWLRDLLGVNFTRAYAQQFYVLALFLGLALLLGVAAGFYPAVFLSGFKTDQVLKGGSKARGNRPVREVLIVLQFAVTITLLVVTVVVWQQLHYMSNRKLGYQKEQVLVLSTPRATEINTALLKQELRRIPAVTSLSLSSGTPLSYGFRYDSIRGQALKVGEFEADEDFLKTLRIKLARGRDFSPRFGTDAQRAVVVNEAMVKAQGWKNPIGQPLQANRPERVVGVVRDFHLGSLHHPVHPVIINLEPKIMYSQVVLVRLHTRDVPGSVEAIRQVWQRLTPADPLALAFLDESYEALYQGEKRLRNIIFLFAGLGIAIGCLGLLGLAAFTVEQRTKEIGIRKVLGASVLNIITLLSGNYLKLVGVAFLLALPLAWYLTGQWLEGFALRVTVHWLTYLAIGAVTGVSVLVTVGYHTLKAARDNPANALRTE